MPLLRKLKSSKILPSLPHVAHHPETVLSVRAEAMQDKARLSVVEDDGFVCKRYLSRLSSAGHHRRKLRRLCQTKRQGNLHALQPPSPS